MSCCVGIHQYTECTIGRGGVTSLVHSVLFILAVSDVPPIYKVLRFAWPLTGGIIFLCCQAALLTILSDCDRLLNEMNEGIRAI